MRVTCYNPIGIVTPETRIVQTFNCLPNIILFGLDGILQAL